MALPVASVLVRFLVGDVPKEVGRALLSARLAGISKASGGTRVLGCGGVMRRMASKHAAKELQATFRQYCGPLQFGLQPDGTGRLHRLVTATMGVRKGIVVAGVDQGDAFAKVRRASAVRACDKASAVLGCVARSILSADSSHVLHGDDASEMLTQVCGFDQGDPISPGMYSVSVVEALDLARAAMRLIDSQAEVAAFYDDTYFMVCQRRWTRASRPTRLCCGGIWTSRRTLRSARSS